MSQILLDLYSIKEKVMKKFAVVLVFLFVFSASVNAQMSGGMMGDQKSDTKQQGIMDEGMMKQMMPMMEKCQMMMKQMMGEGMMKQDMMQMMMDMMNMQESMMKGMKPEEKKKMMKDMGQMKEKMQKMISMHMGMMMGMGDPQAKLKCAETWLKKAIDLHEVHIKDPRTATEASQMEMMDQMKKAYGCIAGTVTETSGEPVKEPGSKEPGKTAPPKTDPHKH